MVGALIGTALVSGCSAKQEANDTLPTAAAETTEALPEVGPADFSVPDEARTKDAAGAEAFLRYWIELLNRQQAIPAGQPLRDLSLECRECLRIARIYDEAHAAGRRYEGGRLSIVEVGAPVMEVDAANVPFIASEAAVHLVDASGIAVESLDAAPRLSSGVTLLWSDANHSWLVASMTLG